MADLVWERLGDVDNFIEPFMGSAAVLLARPTAPRIETANDFDCYVANFWRATSKDPDAVAEYADGPVNEADLHSRHRWLVLSDNAMSFRDRIRTDPDYYDVRVAGWWCWGLCCWIGSGWCSEQGARSNQVPGAAYGAISGVHAISGGVTEKRPILAAPENKSGRRSHHGIGVHSKGPQTADQEKRPVLGIPNGRGGAGSPGRGVHATGPSDGNRPQLADAYARGRGVHGNDSAGTCAERRAWLVGWFQRLRDRLRTVRVCCGDWRRVCDSHSVTTRLGLTGIFFDPPYSAEADRCNTLYGVESKTVAHDVRAYCLERGSDPMMRIVLAGYADEGHEELEANGWAVVAWKATGGYGNRSEKGQANAGRERLWFSPHCIDPAVADFPLFANLQP